MVISALIRSIRDKLTESGNENAAHEAEMIVTDILHCDTAYMIVNGNKEITEAQTAAALGFAERRTHHEPLQYILGHAEFMGLDFALNKATLIPRPDTETLVTSVLDEIKADADVIDIGCGSGCIGISLAHFRPDCRMTFLDKSRGALEMAQQNAERHGVQGIFVNTDIMAECPAGKYDALLSNPPYIRSAEIGGLMEDVRDYEPHAALDGGKTGLDFYKRIISLAEKILRKNGIIAFEIGYDQGKEVADMMKRCFADVKVIKDYGDNDRVVKGIKPEQ